MIIRRRRRTRRLAVLAASVAVLPVATGCAAIAPIVEPISLTVVAQDVQFTPTRVQLPAGVPIHVTFRNGDAGIPHDLDLSPMRSGVVAPVLLDGEVIIGPAAVEFDLEPLARGPYLFSCSVHPSMQIEAEAV